MKKGQSKGKGNGFEWITARNLSLWLTGGTDNSQLIRSVQSGGSTRLRSLSSSQPEYQVGDLAPNGPEGERFRKNFGVECKNYKTDPDWWHCITYKDWVVEGWWNKIKEECLPVRLEPLLVMLRNGRPTVVMIREMLCAELARPEIVIPRLNASVITFQSFVQFDPERWYTAIQTIAGKPTE